MVSSVADITQNVSFVEDVFLVPVFGSNWLKCILVLETASLWIVRVDPFKVHSRLLMACCSVERIGNAIEVTHRHASRILIQAQDEAQAVEWHQLLSQTTSQPSAPTDDVSAVPSFNHLPFDVSPSDLPSDVPTDEFDHDVYYMPKHSSQPPLDGDAHSPESEYSIPSENGTRAVAIPSTLSSFSKNNKIYANTPTRPPVLSKPPSLRAPPVGSIDTIPATLPLSKPKPKPVLVQKPDRKKSSASLSTTASSHVPKSPVLTTRSDSKMEPSPITPLPLRCPPLCREIEEKLKVDVNFAPFFVNKKEKEKVIIANNILNI